MNKRAWSSLGVCAVVALATGYGCGGSNSNGNNLSSDGGSDATADTGQTDDGGGDSSMTGDDGGDAAMMTDSGGGDTSTGNDGSMGSDASDGGAGDAASSDGGSSDAASDAPSDASTWDGNTACTQNMTCNYADDAGATQNGVCVSGMCGPCTADGDCSVYGNGYICVAGACVVGNCHNTSSDCSADGGTPVCVNNTCTACDAVTNNTYYVDPANGVDAPNSTGSQMAGGQTATVCAFKTIGYALSVIQKPTSATTIVLLGTDSIETTWPLTIPANVTLKGKAPTFTVTVPGTAATGFVLDGAMSGIESLTISGSAGTAAGINVVAGSATSTEITNVTVSGFVGGDGVLVNGVASALTLGPNVTLQGNLNGLHVTSTGTATSMDTDQANPDVFSGNAEYGVLVDSSGAVNFMGSAGTLGIGSIVAANNVLGGFAFKQQGATGNNQPNSLSGVVAWHNGNGVTGDGLHLEGASVVKVRGSYIGANVIGVNVVASQTSGSPNDLSGMDLGKTGDPGKNTLQSPSSTATDAGVSAQNSGGGLWMQILPNQSQDMYAKGNIWANGSSSIDCTTASPGALSVNNAACAAGVDLCGQSFNPSSSDKVYLDNCSCSPSNNVCQ